jgi:formylglycine-generating enzyme required for sulfatase activity
MLNPRLAISILLSLVALGFACSKQPGITSQPSGKSTLPQLKSFQFDTVTLDVNGRVASRRSLQAKSYTEDLGEGISLEMVLIPAGTFEMGATGNEKGWGAESPQHSVTVPAFFLGEFEVTQAQWRAVANLPQVDRVLNPDPSFFKGDNLPVEQVSWSETVEFCQRLSKNTGREYRLPSEAEWEYAARAGTRGSFAFGETITPEIVNYNGDYPYAGAARGINRRRTVEVGSLGVANAFGLFDMHGSVEEWCRDNWHDNYDEAPTDGSAWTKGGDPEYQVLRGGSWYSSAEYCRYTQRNWLGTDYRFSGVGFRVAASCTGK